jgi:hypothetical protein
MLIRFCCPTRRSRLRKLRGHVARVSAWYGFRQLSYSCSMNVCSVWWCACPTTQLGWPARLPCACIAPDTRTTASGRACLDQSHHGLETPTEPCWICRKRVCALGTQRWQRRLVHWIFSSTAAGEKERSREPLPSVSANVGGTSAPSRAEAQLTSLASQGAFSGVACVSVREETDRCVHVFRGCCWMIRRAASVLGMHT